MSQGSSTRAVPHLARRLAWTMAALALCLGASALAYQRGRRRQEVGDSANPQMNAMLTVGSLAVANSIVAPPASAAASKTASPLDSESVPARGLAPQGDEISALGRESKGELPGPLPVASSDRDDAELVKGELRLFDVQLLAYVVSHDMAHLADCLSAGRGSSHPHGFSPAGPFVASADLFVSREPRTVPQGGQGPEKGRITQSRWNVPAERVPSASSRAQDAVRTCFRQSFHLRDCAWSFPGLAVTGKACLQMNVAPSPGGGLTLTGYTWDTSPTCLGTH